MIIEKLTSYGQVDGPTDQEIVKNIDHALSTIKRGKILIIFGLDHKYFLDDFLRENYRTESMISIDEWYSSDKVQGLTLSRETKDKAIANIKASKILLRERLASGYFSSLWSDRIGKKYGMFDDFISLYEAAFK
jgi:hypothetical protein